MEFNLNSSELDTLQGSMVSNFKAFADDSLINGSVSLDTQDVSSFRAWVNGIKILIFANKYGKGDIYLKTITTRTSELLSHDLNPEIPNECNFDVINILIDLFQITRTKAFFFRAKHLLTSFEYSINKVKNNCYLKSQFLHSYLKLQQTGERDFDAGFHINRLLASILKVSACTSSKVKLIDNKHVLSNQELLFIQRIFIQVGCHFHNPTFIRFSNALADSLITNRTLDHWMVENGQSDLTEIDFLSSYWEVRTLNAITSRDSFSGAPSYSNNKRRGVKRQAFHGTEARNDNFKIMSKIYHNIFCYCLYSDIVFLRKANHQFIKFVNLIRATSIHDNSYRYVAPLLQLIHMLTNVTHCTGFVNKSEHPLINATQVRLSHLLLTNLYPCSFLILQNEELTRLRIFLAQSAGNLKTLRGNFLKFIKSVCRQNSLIRKNLLGTLNMEISANRFKTAMLLLSFNRSTVEHFPHPISGLNNDRSDELIIYPHFERVKLHWHHSVRLYLFTFKTVLSASASDTIALVWNSEKSKIVEIIIDEYDIIILDNFKKPKSLDDALAAILEIVDVSDIGYETAKSFFSAKINLLRRAGLIISLGKLII